MTHHHHHHHHHPHHPHSHHSSNGSGGGGAGGGLSTVASTSVSGSVDQHAIYADISKAAAVAATAAAAAAAAASNASVGPGNGSGTSYQGRLNLGPVTVSDHHINAVSGIANGVSHHHVAGLLPDYQSL